MDVACETAFFTTEALRRGEQPSGVVTAEPARAVFAPFSVRYFGLNDPRAS